MSAGFDADAGEPPLLAVENLGTAFGTEAGELVAVDGVDFTVEDGETVCIVGESGSGKTVATESITRLVDTPPGTITGSTRYRGRDLREFLVGYLLELFDDLGLDRPHVVGNSLGGQQAFLLAIDHDRVDRLPLVGAPGGLSREYPLVFRLLTMHGVSRLLYWLNARGDPLENARESVGRFVVDDSGIPEAFYETLAAAESLPGRAESLRSLNLEQGSFGRMHPVFDISDEVVDIGRPTLFLWGSEDVLWPPEAGRPVADRMPDATLHALPDHGHMPWLEPGEDVARRVRSFLDG